MKESSLVYHIIDSEFSGFDKLMTHGGIYTFLNPVSYLEACKHRDLYQQFDGIFADGVLLAKAIRLLYGEHIVRRSFDMTSLGAELLKYASDNEKSVYFVSAEQEQVEKAVMMINEKYPHLSIAGYRKGFFCNSEEQDETIKQILELNPDFLIVGMGAIKQEEFLLNARQAGFRGIGFTCGGFISQIAQKRIDYYPTWINNMNLRFLYRMYKEPHTRKRYIKAGIVFPIKMIIERFAK